MTTPAKKKSPRKPIKAKSAAKSEGSGKTKSVPRGREQALAEQALKLVDEAASVLRTGILSGAETTAKSRIAAKKKASALLGKASDNLAKAIGAGTSTLQALIKKL